jgi:hypothetical protein
VVIAESGFAALGAHEEAAAAADRRSPGTLLRAAHLPRAARADRGIGSRPAGQADEFRRAGVTLTEVLGPSANSPSATRHSAVVAAA